MSPKYGTNNTAAIQDTISAIPTTWKIERVYSPTLDSAIAMGKKPAAVIKVPVNIGKAVLVHAKPAALTRPIPCSILMAIISTAIMASSTINPSASTKAPNEILCRPIPKYCITAKVIASTNGIENATTKPVRKPSEKKHTTNTISSASISTCTNSPTLSFTAAGWSETLRNSIPKGKVSCRRANSASNALPSTKISPPSRMATAMAKASSPIKRTRGAAGSLKPRRTCAISPKRKVRSSMRMGNSRISFTVSKRPLTRSCTRSVGVSIKPVADTVFCSANACCTACKGKPKLAKRVLDNSIQIFSSCRPKISTLPTSLTLCNCSCTRSA